MRSSFLGGPLVSVLLSALLTSARANDTANQDVAQFSVWNTPPGSATNNGFLRKRPAGTVTVAPRVIGLHLEIPEPSFEDVAIAESVQHDVMNFNEHTARFSSMDAVATYLQKDAGITWLASYSDLASCASSPWCSASWRTDPALGRNRVTVTSVLRAFDTRNVTRCHVTSDEQEAYCHLPMPGMNEWAYFALAVPSNASSMTTSPLPLALVCHEHDASLFNELSAEKAALAAKDPPGIYCHPMNGPSFLATANTYNASNRSDLEVSANLPSQSLYSTMALYKKDCL